MQEAQNSALLQAFGEQRNGEGGPLERPQAVDVPSFGCAEPFWRHLTDGCSLGKLEISVNLVFAPSKEDKVSPEVKADTYGYNGLMGEGLPLGDQ